jgi:hypothetical protein
MIFLYNKKIITQNQDHFQKLHGISYIKCYINLDLIVENDIKIKPSNICRRLLLILPVIGVAQ